MWESGAPGREAKVPQFLDRDPSLIKRRAAEVTDDNSCGVLLQGYPC